MPLALIYKSLNTLHYTFIFPRFEKISLRMTWNCPHQMENTMGHIIENYMSQIQIIRLDNEVKMRI